MDTNLPSHAEVLEKFHTYPVMTRSMIGVCLIGYKSTDLSKTLEELVENGQLFRGAKPGKHRATAFYFLADEAERLAPFIGSVKK